MSTLGVDRSAAYLWAYGLDHGVFADNELIHYLKDVPISRVEEGDVLIAYELNDEPLSPQHGFPARLVVPGYYGTSRARWICRIELADRCAVGLYTTKLYNYAVGNGETRPVCGEFLIQVQNAVL